MTAPEEDFRARLHAVVQEARRAISGNDSYRISRAELERRKRRDEREQRLWRIGGVVTARMERAIVADELLETPALAAVRAWLAAGPAGEREHPFLVLHGESSRGKTVAAIWALANYGGRFVSAEELKRLKRSFNEHDVEEYRKTLKSGLVVLDDLGVERASDDDEEATYTFVNQRQRNALTIVTTNLTVPQLAQRYGGRTFTRLRQLADFEHAVGRDLRARASNG